MKNGSFYRVDLEDKTLKTSNGNKILEYLKSLSIYIEFFLTCKKILQSAALQVYLCSKMITFQNALFKPYLQICLISWKSYTSSLRCCFTLYMVQSTSKVVSICTRGIFGYIFYLVNHKSLS